MGRIIRVGHHAVTRGRLLVAEDNESNRNLLVKLLRMVGLEVKEAANGQEAVEINQQWVPHLIWMDIRMPVMNGITFYQKMAQQYPKVDQRFIFMTGAADRQTIKYLRQQDLCLLTKPFNLTDIRQAVHNILDHGSL